MNAYEIAHKAALKANFDLVEAVEILVEWEIAARNFARTTDLASDWLAADAYSLAKIIGREKANDYEATKAGLI